MVLAKVLQVGTLLRVFTEGDRSLYLTAKLTCPMASRTRAYLDLSRCPSEVSKAKDIQGTLKAIESQAKSLALGPFHPYLIESQPLTVREEHYMTFRDLFDWVDANYDDLVARHGLRETASRHQRYDSMRRLAEIALDIPRP